MRILLLSILFLGSSLLSNLEAGSKSGASPDQNDPREIRGQVIDSSDGTPVVGATIIIEGTSIGATTDFDGYYTIQAPEQGEISLVVSFIGYKTKTIAAGTRRTITISLEQDVTLLDETVVVGFGKQKKVSVTGSVSTIKPGELRTSSTNLSNSLAGRIAGIISVQRSGEPGNDGSNFWIRGVSTFSGSNSPLIFVDDVEISSGDLNSYDPAIIESFTVLKDASTTALYGARGANGVILIKTKSGMVSDNAIVNVRIETSMKTPTQLPKFADGVTYMNLYNEARYNLDPFRPTKYSAEKIQGTIDGLDPILYPNVDWMDKVLNQNAYRRYANANIRGGGKITQYFSSVSVTDESGMLKKGVDVNSSDIDFKRLNFQNNFTVKASPTTKFSLNLNGNFEMYKGPQVTTAGIFGSVLGTSPVNFPATFPKDPNLDSDIVRYGSMSGGFYEGGTFLNPLAELSKGERKTKSSTFLATLRMDQDLKFILPGLYASALVSVKNWSTNSVSQYIQPYYFELQNEDFVNHTYDIGLIGQGGNTALQHSFSNGGDNTIYLQGNIGYNQTFGKHEVGLLAVYTQREVSYYPPGGFIQSLPYRSQGVSSRFTYMFDNRYMLEFNVGYTGSENFAEGHRFGLFPSVSLGYNIANEPLFKSIVGESIDVLKIRGSYGLTGNDQIGAGRFPFVSEVELNDYGRGFTFGENFDNYLPGVSIVRYPRADITWEKSAKLNFGLDLEVGGLFIAADVFSEDRWDILMLRQTIPATSGIGRASPFANIGRVENKGFEVNTTYNRAFGDLIVQIRGNFSYAHNKILEYDENSSLYPNLSRIGRPINQLWGLEADYLFLDQNEINSYYEQKFGSILSPGDIKYIDHTSPYDDPSQQVIIDGNDRIPMGRPSIPEITYGFGVSLNYKAFDLNVFFQGIARTSFFVSNIQPFTTNERNVLQAIADDYWTATNPNPYAFYPRLTEEINTNNTQNSSWWLRDGSFLRLKDLELGYQINKDWRVYLSGQNLLTFSGFKLWDPEMGGGSGMGYPPMTTYNLGLQFKI